MFNEPKRRTQWVSLVIIRAEAAVNLGRRSRGAPYAIGYRILEGVHAEKRACMHLDTGLCWRRLSACHQWRKEQREQRGRCRCHTRSLRRGTHLAEYNVTTVGGSKEREISVVCLDQSAQTRDAARDSVQIGQPRMKPGERQLLLFFLRLLECCRIQQYCMLNRAREGETLMKLTIHKIS